MLKYYYLKVVGGNYMLKIQSQDPLNLKCVVKNSNLFFSPQQKRWLKKLANDRGAHYTQISPNQMRMSFCNIVDYCDFIARFDIDANGV